MPTGKTSQTYGTEYYTQFSEHEQPFPLWFKKEPEIGTTIEGEVVNGKFKKTKKEWKPEQRSEGGGNATPAVARAPFKDNSDGMRQGMCFNNAANYVATLEFKQALTDKEWATTVFSYAQALYRMGDLNVEQEASQTVTEPTDEGLASVQEVFGKGVQVVK